jgi:hypothetical protein
MPLFKNSILHIDTKNAHEQAHVPSIKPEDIIKKILLGTPYIGKKSLKIFSKVPMCQLILPYDDFSWHMLTHEVCIRSFHVPTKSKISSSLCTKLSIFSRVACRLVLLERKKGPIYYPTMVLEV